MRPLPRQPPAIVAYLHSLSERQGKGTVTRAIEVSRWAGEIAEALAWAPEKCERLREAALLFALRRWLHGSHSPRALEEIELLSSVLDDEQSGWVRLGDESWDGDGPEGLAGTQIPDGSRVIRLADTWVTLLGRGDGDGDTAITVCWRDAGSAFWPDAVRALTRLRTRA
jgi:HD-GYP domain-containing protein (c-di-GMP phosphodiesterase class II)